MYKILIFVKTSIIWFYIFNSQTKSYKVAGIVYTIYFHKETHTHTHTHTHAHTHTRTHTCTHARTHALTHTPTHTRTHAHTHVVISAYLNIHKYTNIILTLLSVKDPSQQWVHPISTVLDPEVVPQQMTHVVVHPR